MNSRLRKSSVSKCPQCLTPDVCKDKKHFRDQSSSCVLLVVLTGARLDPDVGMDGVMQKYVMGEIKDQ